MANWAALSTLVLAVASAWTRTSVALAPEHQFDVQRALVDLENIARTPHSLNDVRSIRVRDYLRAAVKTAIAGSDAEFSDPLSNGTVAEFKAKGWMVYWEDSSLVVRVPGMGSGNEALLVQAHYDAVPMSHGAYDDGVGVAVCLELLRSLVRQPTRHPVVINIDWGEENGLFGATLFARFHAWAEDVRAYVNLEAGGVGGRAMLFRASHPALVRAYKQAVPQPCASLIGNDAFKLGIVKSDTDYSVYTTRYGIPGLDLAFTDRRSLYHTIHDSLEHATAASVLSMGIATLNTARQIASSPHILQSLPRSPRMPARPQPAPHAGRRLVASDESFGEARENISITQQRRVVVTSATESASIVEDAVFYDLLSRVMVVRSYAAELRLNMLTGLLGITMVVAVQYPFARPLPGASGPVGISSSTPSEQLVMQLGRGGFFGVLLQALAALAKAYLSGLFGSLIFTGVMICVVVPRLAYTHLVLHTLLLFAAAMLAVTCVLSAWVCQARLADTQRMTWYALCVFRSLVLLLVVVPLNWAGIGLLYREQIYAWAAIGATLLTALADPSTTIGGAWRPWARALCDLLTTCRRGSDPHRQRLLDDNSEVGNMPHHFHSSTAPGLADHKLWAITAVLRLISALRLLLCVLLPLAIGVDVMLRQLTVFKDHLVDGSPPAACVAIAALDIVTFVMFLAPYITGAIAEPNNSWLVHCAGAAVEPCARQLLALWQHSHHAQRDGTGVPRSRSQISLHTNHAADQPPTSARLGSDDEVYPRVVDYPGTGEDSESDSGERIITLGARSDSASRTPRSPYDADSAGAGGNSDGDSDSEDDELGRRSTTPLHARQGETPEAVGRGMVYMWTAAWLALWVLSQLAMLTGERYGEHSNPLKVRVFEATRLDALCIEKRARSECVHSRLSLSSPDAAGLARLMKAAAPDDVPLACFAQNTRGFHQCSLTRGNDDRFSVPQGTSWQPESAIAITAIHHHTTSTSHGTLFNASISFVAPETRTCFIDLGFHTGHSLQSYPNPHPVLPPAPIPGSRPIIARKVLPVIERAHFVNPATGAAAPVSEPASDRDPVFSARIVAHKQDFDDSGLFKAEVQYLLPSVNTTTHPPAIPIDISCYFDQADRHTPLLAAVVSAAPRWATFTPSGNTLSTVTLVGVLI
ncbi:hypothetical protein H4R24_005006 [Coemansia sp. RSA 988]|nr:hypothetical protein H4R24_005006 [Coemansia sp. RSA 988]